jgi:predicted NBD/HSP70 family sugar kinase
MSPNPNQVKNTKELRLYNKKSIIDLLRSRDLITKTEIAKSLNLSFATTSNLCNELIEEQIFLLARRSTTSGGRPSELLTLNETARISFCIDFTYKTSVRLLFVDLRNKPLVQKTFPLAGNAAISELAQQCADGLRELLEEAQLQPECILGASVIIPGLQDLRTGSVLNSTLPVLDHYNLKEFLSQTLDLPVCIENDANLAALATSWRAGSQRQENILFIYIGEGLGLGILSATGSIYRGERGYAGEIAHIPLGDSRYACYCGNTGCIEGVLSNSGIERLRSEHAEPAAYAGELLGKLISILINLMDPQAVYIGGDEESLLKEMLPYVQTEASRRLLMQKYRDVPLLVCPDVHDLFSQGASELLIREWLMK